MPRQLNDKPCEVTFQDRLSTDKNGNPSKITLYYRLPTTEERIGYANAQIVREGNSVKNNMGEARLKYGLKIFKGFKDGAFDQDEGKPLSSNPGSPAYNPAWKTIVKQYASDIISLLAIHVFDASVVTSAPDVPPPSPENDEEEDEAGDKATGGDDPSVQTADGAQDATGNSGMEGKEENPL